MKSEGIADNVIRTFEAYYELLVQGSSGKIGRSEIAPPQDSNLVDYNDLSSYRKEEMLKETVVIKLNGGLGTSMGLSKAKSLLPVKGNMTFLDIIVRQILTLRAESGYDVQLLFMNSYSTDEDTNRFLDRYPDLKKGGLPLGFVQNKFPRIRQDNFKVFESQNREAMWNPPGHGDIFTAISSSGLLDKLIDGGYRYAFVSNSDNLGASVDTAIPAYMQAHNIPFIMEVCNRSEADKKGGHLCEDKDGVLRLREIAQCPDQELAEFQDIEIYKYFNTNNLWIDLKALQWHLIVGDGVILLPLIINPKSVENTPVYQLETAMGSAISVFANSKALMVPRQRFAPVKKTSDLLTIWSDAYELNDKYQIVLKRGLSNVPLVVLDDKYYKDIDQLSERCTEGIPSLMGCKKLSITGDVWFGQDLICEGNVDIKASGRVQLKNRLLTGELQL